MKRAERRHVFSIKPDGSREGLFEVTISMDCTGLFFILLDILLSLKSLDFKKKNKSRRTDARKYILYSGILDCSHCDDACDCPGGPRLHQSPLFGKDMGSLIQLCHLQSCCLAGTFGAKHLQDVLHVHLVLLLHPHTSHLHSQCHPVSQPHPNILEEPDYDRGSLRCTDVSQCLCGFPLDPH